MSENSKLRGAANISRLRRQASATGREIAIALAFCVLTAVMTWPWVVHLRDAVSDRGDPYMIAWTLWWDYHQTFNNPLQLFDANVFYPYKYTLAFSENDFGIALLFFPLFAAGLKPLTIHSIATFLGFAFCGFGAFRLTRTLTGRNGSAWIAGIVFAFIPFRFHVLSHLHYLFAGWIPLLLESLILFARETSWKRAGWMGVAFLMNGLSCISWLIMTIVPMTLTVLFLVVARESLRRSRQFWLRGALAITAASVVLFPFLWPYYRVSTLYGLRWQPWEFAFNSPSIIHWFKAESRNKLWQNFGAMIPGGHALFPGMLAPLLAIASLRIGDQRKSRIQLENRLALLIDFVIATAAFIAVLGIGYGDTIYRLFGHRVLRLNSRSVTQALTIVMLAVGLRLGLWLRTLIRNGRSMHRSNAAHFNIDWSKGFREAIGIGVIWTVAGFLSSLGANFFFNRWLHDYLILYQSIRIPSRAAMVCYLGLAILAGIGAARLADRAQQIFSRRHVEIGAFLLIALAILFELHASPLRLESGEVDPTSLSLRLRRTQMNGGIVELPSSEPDVSRHFYMLRAADHGRPLINGTSSFISPLTDQINKATDGKMAPNFIDLLEKIPASYLVVHNERLLPGWQTEYEIFLARSLSSGRLRFINRFDGHDDLYAVTKTEPGATSEANVPFSLARHEWAAMIDKDESNILAPPTRSQTLYRIHLATTRTLPRYAEFIKDIKTVARGIFRESGDEEQVFEKNLREFTDTWVHREPFSSSLGGLDDVHYVDQLLANAGIIAAADERSMLISGLADKSETRASVLLKVVNDRRFVDKENARSLVLLHYFAYLHRNPGDPPDRDLSGFNFWIQDLAKQPDAARLSFAFQNSIEYVTKKRH